MLSMTVTLAITHAIAKKNKLNIFLHSSKIFRDYLICGEFKTYYLNVWRKKLRNFQSLKEGFKCRQKIFNVKHVTLHWSKFFDQIFDVFFDIKSLPRVAMIDNVESGNVFFAASHPIDLQKKNPTIFIQTFYVKYMLTLESRSIPVLG